MNIENLSLAEIVTAKPSAAALFENLQLDFCCKGKQKLNEALSNDQLKLASAIEQLENLFAEDKSKEIDFSKYSLPELIDYIVKNHHQYVKDNMPVIQQHLRKVVSKHGENYPFMKKIEELFTEICLDFTQHLMKEELILFPKIKKTDSNPDNSNSIKTIINVMENEHQDAGQMMEEIRKLSNNFSAPDNACITLRVCIDELRLFEEDLHKHVHLENNILFPKAIDLQEDGNLMSCSCSI